MQLGQNGALWFTLFLSDGGDPKRRGAGVAYTLLHPLDGPISRWPLTAANV